MKKTLILLTLTVATTLTLTGCGIFSKTKSDVASFESAATNAGLQSLSIDGVPLPSDVEDYVVYHDADMTYQVEFYDLSNTTAAENLFNDLVDYVEDEEGMGTFTNSRVSSINYATNTYGSGDAYYYITRVDDTIFFGHTESAGKDAVKAISDAIGY